MSLSSFLVQPLQPRDLKLLGPDLPIDIIGVS
jgi:hypothetical protein